eukprot:TRINITY_DN3612_c0_g1_i9.p1 TRINITY_DN3612_c0_g1~~TRINITY_DN3612_c0_g1_i9.p1  ORF type:complete len:126 (+),score=23.60 TRINITY_DN3612_c0_g1_i9:245-622(+)
MQHEVDPFSSHLLQQRNLRVFDKAPPSSSLCSSCFCIRACNKFALQPQKPRDFLHLLKVFGRGEPLVLKLTIISEYIIFPGAMFVALIYSPENNPIKRKGNHNWGGRGKTMEGRKGKWENGVSSD